MNSYGSMSRVSESIYKILRYMNWISSSNDEIVVPMQPKSQSHAE
jgi:hypothetical protein